MSKTSNKHNGRKAKKLSGSANRRPDVSREGKAVPNQHPKERRFFVDLASFSNGRAGSETVTLAIKNATASVGAEIRSAETLVNKSVGSLVSAAKAVMRPISFPPLTIKAPAEDYVDPILFEEGIYNDQADYEQTIDGLAERINTGAAVQKGREERSE